MDENPTKKPEEKRLVSEVWHTYMTKGGDVRSMHLPWFEHPALKPIYRAMPSEHRCHICYIPFSGFGGFIAKRFLDVRPSPMNPQFCNTCERFAEKFPGGAEIEVTILFADIRGSTPLAEELGRQEYSELIHRFYIAGTKPLYRNNALIEKFIGDGLTAFFPPAFAGPNHAQSAVKAGREILQATGHGEGKTPWIPVGVGIETGTAYIGAVQMEGGRADITILGDVVNTAARICSQAAAGEILVGNAAMKMSGSSKDENEKRELLLKGKQETVDAWVIKP